MNYLWLVVPQGTILISSTIVLSIQKAYFHRLNKCQEANQAQTSPYKEDLVRKGSFSNRKPLICIHIEALLMTILSAYVLVHKVQHRDTMISIISSLVELGVWLYCVVLSLVFWQYLLSHKFGWTLNVHMRLLFIVQCIALVIRALNSEMAFALWILVLIGFNLVYLTSNMKQGSPFLDQDGRVVSLQTVKSLVGNLFFSWLTPLVNTVNSKGKDTTDTDLPVLPAFSRAHNLFYVFRHTNAKKSLLDRIFLVNKRAITLQFSLAVLTGVVQFGQPVFLKMILLHIQHMEEWDKQWFMLDVFYVFMMAVCGAVDNLLTAQLWFVGNMN
ncbi:uncharacterized protein B0P05DRAFT_606910 [Gilbertella persicaria]|uniref:uncharacterized protein n=1 Tax=Gilbertella persicaria TaxID=101096 RepID=UPI0022206CE0|nr:uncharacterized protein B0P05DRAFT_606910 [Gilbertella persicaria]KAI8098111.1 hypothetical protein B0P05DRAFT_606910 [Gilbertella persicaria]